MCDKIVEIPAFTSFIIFSIEDNSSKILCHILHPRNQDRDRWNINNIRLSLASSGPDAEKENPSSLDEESQTGLTISRPLSPRRIC